MRSPCERPFDALLGAQMEALQQRLRVRLVPARIDRLHEAHVPGERRAAEQAHVVGDEADVPLRARLLCRHRVPEHADLARVLLDQGHQQAGSSSSCRRRSGRRSP